MKQYITEILDHSEHLLSAMELKAIRERLEASGFAQEALDREVSAQQGAYNQNLVVQTSETAYKDHLKRLALEAGLDVPPEPNHVQARAEIFTNNRHTTFGIVTLTLRWAWDKLSHLMGEIAHFEQHLKDKQAIIDARQETITTQGNSIARQETLIERLRARIYDLEHPDQYAERVRRDPRFRALLNSLPDEEVALAAVPKLESFFLTTEGFLRLLQMLIDKDATSYEACCSTSFLEPFVAWFHPEAKVSRDPTNLFRQCKEKLHPKKEK